LFVPIDSNKPGVYFVFHGEVSCRAETLVGC
jgi:hypothetical protein